MFLGLLLYILGALKIHHDIFSIDLFLYFTGVFNGLGYRIYNPSVSTGGLFGNVAKRGLIKNVNIHNAQLNDSWSGAVAHSISGRMENCSVEVNANKIKQVSAICFLLNDGKVKNVHITTKGLYDNGGSDKNSAVVYWSKGSNCELVNVSVNAVDTGVLIGSDQAKLNDYIIIRGDENIGEDATAEDFGWTLL